MSWLIRQCGEDLYHHIYAWGNDRHPIFKHPNHFLKYLELLNDYAKTYDISVIAFALMEWHVHLFVHDKHNNLSKFMMDFHGNYAQYYNRVTQKVGHVFGERFNNKIVKCSIYGKWLSRYIHRQPLEAGIVYKPQDYRWSSYRVYLGQETSAMVKPDIILEEFGKKGQRSVNYQEFVEDNNEGPVDWNARSFRFRSIPELVTKACTELSINPDIVKKPRGRHEQKQRSQIVTYLVRKFDLKPISIAKSLGLSRSTITRILQRSARYSAIQIDIE